ncbi:MAG: shikimate kinase, partial [Gluconacetobacter diazotrophicus]|nr:shikimate kinase [Gluconacetobacter diazotrophicus]
IFAVQGEEAFRSLETAALRSLVGSQRLIIATGGGIVNAAGNHPLLQALGCVVWLTAQEEVLYERVSRNQRRPLLRTPDPRATLHSLLERRRPLYAACAHVTVDTSTDGHAQVAQTVFGQARAFFTARESAQT